MKEHTNIKQEGTEVYGRTGDGFKKKNNFRKIAQINNNSVDDVLRRVGFKIAKEGPELYATTIERLGLYTSTQFKNGADIKNA